MTTRAQRKLVELRLAEIRKAKQKRVRWFKWTGFAGKTLWDWLQLLGVLAIPLVVAGATLGFGLLQQHLADVQHQRDQQAATLQHQQDQAIALDQQRATILQTYLDNIQDLLLNHNLLKSQSDSDVAILARARTLTALQGLDAMRKGQLLIFLYQANLIGFVENGKTHARIINLGGVNLSGFYLNGQPLVYAPGGLPNGVILDGANLSGANLSGAILDHAHLSEANLSGATLTEASLAYADLNGANLSRATLDDTSLGDANLSGAYLSSASLLDTDLLATNFSGANLSGAYLGTQYFTQQQLNQVSSCKGATLPEGLICHKTSS